METLRGYVSQSRNQTSRLTALVCQANILVDQTCHARLADFGFLEVPPKSTISNGTIRWMSPELLDPEIQDHRPTTCSDCYGLGMVIYEVLSRRVPFYQYSDLSIFEKVMQGDRPKRAQGVEGIWFTDDTWKLLERCWVPIPGERPSIDDVLRCLKKASNLRIQPSPA